jgi:folylpolyglutamate synthase/dihydropteroate synthase
VESLQLLYPNKKFVTVFAAKKDKDTSTMIRLLSPVVSKFIITKFTIHTDFGPYQAADPDEIAKSVNLDYEVIPDPKKALEKALSQKKEPVLVTGSLYLIGEINRFLV